MKNVIVTLIVFLAMNVLPGNAQRIQQNLGRSVVAVTDPAGQNVLVTWRRLAQEPENCKYNIYKRTRGGGDYTLVNESPLSKTNFQTTRSVIPYNTELAVTRVLDEEESEKSIPYLFKQQSYKDVFFDFNFETEVLTPNNYRTKYAWPMDLDGNGNFDAILVDRLYVGGSADPGCNTQSHKLQAYALDGTCLWTVDMGYNVVIDGGHNDMVVAYDINCDGKCEVIIKSSDGTRFWDATAKSWGKFVGGNITGDSDNDGIIDYRSSSKNPPFYISVIDGRSGAELTCSELNYAEVHDNGDQYGRNNRSDYMNDNEGTEYAFLGGKFAICYFDGLHPSLVMEAMNRRNDNGHHYYVLVWSYDWDGGKPSNWHHSYTWSRNDKTPWPAEFHQLRVADVDGDGVDEMLDGGFAVNPHKGMVFSAGIGHGDRYDVSDIDPDRPGMETYAIQQSNLMGQVLYDAATGEHIKEWYLASVSDVGRGRCIDVDASRKGYEMFSTMGNLYDCKGEVITAGETTYPTEAIWWDGDLQRELIASPGGKNFGTNMMIQKYNGTRLVQFSRESNWAVMGATAVRPAYMGDMTGDWREEIVLMKQNDESSTGLIGYSTDIPSDYSFYTLQEDPHYRLDCTTRGYYQMPCTGFYLGGGMPYPPLPPVMVTDLRWDNGSTWSVGGDGFVRFDHTVSVAYKDGQSVIFDMGGQNGKVVEIQGTLSPSSVYLMTPKGKDYVFGGSGTLSGTMELWKSMQGSATFENNLVYTGQTVVSEGTLCLNGKIAGPVDVRAKGTLAGIGEFDGEISFEGALNYEGCRLMLGNSVQPYGVMTFNRNLTLPGGVYVEVNVKAGMCGKLMVKGDLTLKGVNTFTINLGETEAVDGTYVLAECTGLLTADAAKIKIRGLEGLNYDIKTNGNQILLVVNSTREAMQNVVWIGGESAVWNHKDFNFTVNEEPTSYVSGDEVVFNDRSTVRNVRLDEIMTPKDVVFDFDEGVYTFSGKGGIGGEGTITKDGKGELKMNLKNSSYTGATVINEGILTVSEIYDGGTACSLGAAPAGEGYLQLNGGTLRVEALNAATDRTITLTDTSTIDIAMEGASMALKGLVKGDGYLIKEGSGQLNFTYGGTYPFSGMIVREGRISQGAWNATFGKVGGSMLLAGGEVALIDMNNSDTRPIFNYVTTVQEGTESRIIGTTRGAIEGTFRGRGTVTIVSAGVRNDIGADFSAFEGTLKAEGGNFRLMDNVTDMRKTLMEMASGCYVGHYKSNNKDARAITTKIGMLTSASADCSIGNGIDSYEVGYSNESGQYSGMLKAKTITKCGSGVWTIDNEGSTSEIVVKGGTLQVYNRQSSTPITGGAMSVMSGATLTGLGCVGNVTVRNGGTLASGYNGRYGSLDLSGRVSMNQGSRMKVRIGVSSSGRRKVDEFEVSGRLVHSQDTLVICVEPGCNLVAGEEISIFTITGEHTGNYILKSESSDCDIVWDDSRLLTEGVLVVQSVMTGISSVPKDKNTLVDVYSVGGMKLREQVHFSTALDGLPRGIYLVNGCKIIK